MGRRSGKAPRLVDRVRSADGRKVKITYVDQVDIVPVDQRGPFKGLSTERYHRVAQRLVDRERVRDERYARCSPAWVRRHWRLVTVARQRLRRRSCRAGRRRAGAQRAVRSRGPPADDDDLDPALRWHAPDAGALGEPVFEVLFSPSSR